MEMMEQENYGDDGIAGYYEDNQIAAMDDYWDNDTSSFFSKKFGKAYSRWATTDDSTQ